MARFPNCNALTNALATGNVEVALGIVQTNVQLYGAQAVGPIGAALLKYQQHIQQVELQMAQGKASQFVGNCQPVAQSLFNAFKAAGLNPTFVRLYSGASNLNIHTVSTRFNAAVSTNGTHYAVQLGGRIYDAFTGLNGIAANQYARLFMTPAGQMTQSQLQNIGTQLPP